MVYLSSYCACNFVGIKSVIYFIMLLFLLIPSTKEVTADIN